MKTILLGKGNLAIKIGEWFLKSPKYELICVIPDVPEPTWNDSLIQWCQNNKMRYLESGDYRYFIEKIDLAISVFYGKIIKKEFIDRCGKIINLHNGPLPKYRGVRPINWALKNRETTHGVTIHQITPGIDDGPIYGQVIYPIYPEIEEVLDVYVKSLYYGYQLFLDVISKLDKITPIEQDHSLATYYSNKENYLLKERESWTR